MLHVYPPTWRAAKQEPNFTGLMAAYAGAGTGDWNVVYQHKVGPGDIILVHAGLYKGDRRNYVDPLSTTFDGAYLLTAKGTPDRPIVIRAAGDGEVIFDGDGAFRLFDVMAADYHIFEGLTIRNTEVAFWAGVKDVAGSKGLTVRNCRIENVGVGVTTQFAGSKDYYIADNIFLGRDDRHRVLGWASPGLYGAHPINSYYAVKVYGSGHVIAHNAVAFFHDGISVCTHGVPEPEQELKAVAIDIYNNDIHVTGDDFIEADGGVHNIRVMRNRGRQRGPHRAERAADLRRPGVLHPQHRLQHARGAEVQQPGRGDRLSQHDHRGEPHRATRLERALQEQPVSGHRCAGGIAVLGGPTAYSTYDYNGYRPNRGAEIASTRGSVRNQACRSTTRSPPSRRRGSRRWRSSPRPPARRRMGSKSTTTSSRACGPPVPPDSSKPGTPYEAVELEFPV